MENDNLLIGLCRIVKFWWETWLIKRSEARLKFRGAQLHKVDLSWRDLRDADFNGANLTRATLTGADLRGVDLRGADLKGARLENAGLCLANLVGANLRDACLIKADLSDTRLIDADLRGANLSRADLRGANLAGADLSEANLFKANLLGANLAEANLREAWLPLAICSFVNLEKAVLSKTYLWGIQREHWKIKGIRCSSVYWDEEGKTLTQYADGDFERLFSDKTKIQIFYKDGLNTLEIVSLPALIQHLESLHQGCKLRFQSITEASGGAVVEIVVDEGDEFQRVIEQEASLAQQKLRFAFESQEQFLQGKLAGFQEGIQFILRETLPFMSNNPTININSPVVHGTLAGYVQGDVIYNAAQLTDAGKLVETLTAKVDSIPSLEPDQRQKLNQALTTAKTELEKPQPSHPVVQSAISVVRSILEKSAAQWLTSHAGDIWDALQKLPHLPM